MLNLMEIFIENVMLMKYREHIKYLCISVDLSIEISLYWKRRLCDKCNISFQQHTGLCHHH